MCVFSMAAAIKMVLPCKLEKGTLFWRVRGLAGEALTESGSHTLV